MMMNYLVDGELLLTGDTLFVDSVGRTELQFGEDDDASRGAELLYDSLHETILNLPDDTTILPGHLTVTSDGRYENGSPGEPLEARLGDLRDELDFLGLDREAFVERLTEDTPRNLQTTRQLSPLTPAKRPSKTKVRRRNSNWDRTTVPHRSQHLLSRRNLLQLTGATSLGALAGCTGQLPGSDDGARGREVSPRATVTAEPDTSVSLTAASGSIRPSPTRRRPTGCTRDSSWTGATRSGG